MGVSESGLASRNRPGASTAVRATRLLLRLRMGLVPKSGFRNHGNATLVGAMRGERGERLHRQIVVWNP